MFASVGKAYITQAFLQHFGTVDLDGAPTKHMFDGDITEATDEQLHVKGLIVPRFWLTLFIIIYTLLMNSESVSVFLNFDFDFNGF